MTYNLPISVKGPDDEPDAVTDNSLFERHPKNAPGPFYVVKGECLHCCLAPHEAPELMASPVDTNEDCYFKRQPETPEEVEHAINAVMITEMDCIRYGGDDPAIIQRLGEKCDRYPRF